MNIFNKFGLGPKKQQTLPFKGEKQKKEEEAYSLKKNPYIRWTIFGVFILISILSLPRSEVRTTTNYTTGQPWRADDLTAPFTFAINKTQTEIEQERAEIQQQIPPVFVVDNTAQVSIQSEIDSIYISTQSLLQDYHIWQLSKANNGPTDLEDSVRFSNELQNISLGLTNPSLELLMQSYHQIAGDTVNITVNQVFANPNFVGNKVKNALITLLNILLNQGIVDVNKSMAGYDVFTLLNISASTEQPMNIARVRDLREANEYSLVQLNARLNTEETRLAVEIYNKVMKANYLNSSTRYQQRINEAIANISPTKGAIAQGQVIVRRGDIVTEQIANTLESLDAARTLNASTFERYLRLLGGIVLVVVISFIFYIYLHLYRRKIFDDNAQFLLVFLVMSLITAPAGALLYFDLVHPLIIPIAIAPIILTIIFDSRVGIIASLTLASLIGLVHGYDFEYTISSITACSMGVFSVRDIRDRSQFFFGTPSIVWGAFLLTLGAFSLAKMDSLDVMTNYLFYITISCVLILFTYPLILLIEKLFDVVTDFTLLELGDTNQPLLKELMNKAPGTFHHSMHVANLAESAASAIGAKALLSRVGALYHDIGKILKPEYYVENQSSGVNEHDKLKPQMSAMIIKAHVSEGIKIAQEAGLPNKLIDFISTHHGTSFIRYFFEKAKDNDSIKEVTAEEKFRYDGPLPATKETGILLLADGIEAASRAIKNPTYPRLENLVNRMVDERVKEGQLGHCPLTFRDLQIIKETFLTVLMGIYHQRVEYPEDKAEEAKESAKNEIDSKPDVDSVPVVDAEVGNTLESNSEPNIGSEPEADKPANTEPTS